MSIADEIVSVAFAAIAGAVSLTEQDREKARAAVTAKLDEIARLDPGPLKPRADAIRAKHVAAIAARHGLDPATVSVLTPPAVPLPSPQVFSAAARVRTLAESIVLSHEDREALRIVTDHVDPDGEHERRMRRADEDTREVPVGPERPR